MTRKVIVVLFIGILIWLSSERLKGISYWLILSRDEIVVRQLQGDGCGYQEYCDFHWFTFSGFNIRNPDFHCKMEAARCALKLGVRSTVVIEGIQNAIGLMPATFDTGDGIIQYRECLESVLKEMEVPGSSHYSGACSS